MANSEMLSTPSWRALYRREWLPATIGNTAINELVAWLMFSGASGVPRGGIPSVLFDLVPTTFMSTVMLTVITTVLLRRRLFRTSPIGSRLAFGLVKRSVAFAIVATILVVPTVSAGISLLTPPLWSWPAFLLFKAAFIAVTTLATLPFVLRAVLNRDVPAAAR